MNKNTIKDILGYLLIIVLVILIRIFIFDPVKVDGPSMDTTLLNGQILILNKFDLRKNGINRYDIVVIKLDNGTKIIKRVMGLPNETISIKNNKVYANGEELDNSFASSKTGDFELGKDLGLEKIPGDSYFVLGDNRDVSLDSRFPTVGVIKKDKIIGKVSIRIWPLNKIGKVR
jgi:signal peptidase I